MRIFKRALIALTAAPFFFALSAQAVSQPIGQLLNGNGECYVHEYEEGEIVSLNVAPYALLSIQMPTNVFHATMGGGRLWSVNYSQDNPLPFMWVKAKTDDGYQGQTTSLTVLDEDMRPFHIVVNRRKNPGYTCAKLVLGQEAKLQRRLGSWKSKDSLRAEAAIRQANQREALAQRKVDAIKEHAAEQIKAQRAQLFSNYDWKQKGKLLNFGSDKPLIRSVMDDGLFTYITLNDASMGLMSLYGVYGDKEHLVQMQYDPQLMQYTVSGVYNKIVMRYQESSITIARKELD